MKKKIYVSNIKYSTKYKKIIKILETPLNYYNKKVHFNNG